MTAAASVLSPIQQSPLKVTDKDNQLVAHDPNGALVLTSIRGTYGAPHAIALETAIGAWRVLSAVGSINQVVDRSGQSVANLERRAFRSTLIQLPGGEVIPVTRGMFRIFGMGCGVGDLASARAPFLMPQRYFKLTFKDALLQRPDRDLIIALSAYLANKMIDAQITAAQSSSSP